jgi:ABC-2 type transport system ATP-binding protein
MTTPVIETRGLVKRYGAATAVGGIDLSISAGEIFGLLGPNGAGKTTTILMLLGLIEPSAGTIRVLGHDPVTEPLAVKHRIGYMPDSLGFYDNMTARENLRYSARLAGLRAAQAEARIDEALARVRLADVAHKKAGTYSHGMKQRLGLAEVLIKQPEVAILDEPTSGLDPQSTTEFLDLIRDLRASGIAVLLSSHLLERVQTVCDRVALFNGGKIALQGSVAELGRTVLGAGGIILIEAEGVTAAQISAMPGVSGLVEEKPRQFRVRAERSAAPDVARAIMQAGGRLYRLTTVEPSLDEIYNRYFEGVRHAA